MNTKFDTRSANEASTTPASASSRDLGTSLLSKLPKALSLPLLAAGMLHAADDLSPVKASASGAGVAPSGAGVAVESKAAVVSQPATPESRPVQYPVASLVAGQDPEATRRAALFESLSEHCKLYPLTAENVTTGGYRITVPTSSGPVSYSLVDRAEKRWLVDLGPSGQAELRGIPYAAAWRIFEFEGNTELAATMQEKAGPPKAIPIARVYPEAE